MKKGLLFSLLLFLTTTLFAQSIQFTYPFVERDSTLFLDLYVPQAWTSEAHTEVIASDVTREKPCIIFIFGGAFMMGSRTQEDIKAYCQTLNEAGYPAIAIDYRLFLNKETRISPTRYQPLDTAIRMAVEDLYAAVSYLHANPERFPFNLSKIVLIGSSAGAITALQADYELCNRTEISKVLPEGFRFGGIVAFSGAVFSKQGKLKYAQNPAPTFMAHGINDRLVPYKQLRLGRLGFFGSNAIAKRFEKFDYPYTILRYENIGHEIAGHFTVNLPEILTFIETCVMKERYLRVDQTINDPSIPRWKGWNGLSNISW